MCPLRILVILLSLGIAFISLILSMLYTNDDTTSNSTIKSIIFDNAAEVKSYTRQLYEFCNGQYIYNMYQRINNRQPISNNTTAESIKPVPQCPFATMHHKLTGASSLSCPFSKSSHISQSTAQTTN